MTPMDEDLLKTRVIDIFCIKIGLVFNLTLFLSLASKKKPLVYLTFYFQGIGSDLETVPPSLGLAAGSGP